MPSTDDRDATTRALHTASWVLTGMFAVFMAFVIGIKLIHRPEVAQTLAALGWPASYGFMIGVMELVLLVLYLVPRTTVLGAVLLTALFGATVATHARIGSPLVSHTLFGVYLAIIMWGALVLRLPTLRRLLLTGR